MQYFSFCDWFISVSIMPSGFIHVVACVRISFLFESWIIFCCMYLPHYVYSFIRWWTLGLLSPLGYRNTAMNMGEQIPLQDPAFSSFWDIPRSGIAGFYGNSIFTFLRNWHTWYSWPFQIQFSLFVNKFHGNLRHKYKITKY